MDQVENNACRLREFIDALDEERRKVEAFHRELPLCLQLINQTIESYKQMMVESGERSRFELAMKEMEFISLRPSSAGSSEERSNQLLLSSAQSQQDPLPKMVTPEKPIAIRATRNWREAQDSERDEDNEGEHGSEDTKIEKGQGRRKVRRYWSEDLHKRFLHALEQLGGCDAATPKHIRKLMKVDGLTNDEVKSHLQKFRIHARRSSSSSNQGSSSISYNLQSPQFMVVSGIWIPTPEYAIVTSTDAHAASATGSVQAETRRYPPLLFQLDQGNQQQPTNSD
ncbi:hypothetical protein Cni_G25698 [Canna indica]|uniref:HTH myb-type domain-containing protein n=1 Tax=Canna indica TaxID=4628 RepID=A0AAQ3KYE0_9LILI|nr:hypothetical protein Cni_G25698 [Canna indica]